MTRNEGLLPITSEELNLVRNHTSGEADSPGHADLQMATALAADLTVTSQETLNQSQPSKLP